MIKPFLEKYLKKLMGKNNIEDALKRLDRLTQEEARMASAQLLKISTAINNGVGEIADHVLVVDDRVAGVDERVVGVDKRVVGVDERVASGLQRLEDLINSLAEAQRHPRTPTPVESLFDSESDTSSMIRYLRERWERLRQQPQTLIAPTPVGHEYH